MLTALADSNEEGVDHASLPSPWGLQRRQVKITEETENGLMIHMKKNAFVFKEYIWCLLFNSTILSDVLVLNIIRLSKS